MDQLHAVPVRQPMIRGIEVAPLIQLGLIARVIQHRMHAVFVRQREAEHLEFDRDRPPGRIGTHVNRASVQAGRTVAADVHLDPDCLVPERIDLHREAAAPAARILGHELHRFPSCRIRRGPWGSAIVHPRRI
jgi:hypothetical protein